MTTSNTISVAWPELSSWIADLDSKLVWDIGGMHSDSTKFNWNHIIVSCINQFYCNGILIHSLLIPFRQSVIPDFTQLFHRKNYFTIFHAKANTHSLGTGVTNIFSIYYMIFHSNKMLVTPGERERERKKKHEFFWAPRLGTIYRGK